ncbi:MAG: hypothetical protein ACE5SW_08710 [Nitrososphaeraceae archaeon]
MSIILGISLIFSLTTTITVITTNTDVNKAFGHSFTSDDSVTFLSLAKRAITELELAKKNFPSNITIAMDHSDNAARLVNDVYYVDDDIVDDQDFIIRYDKEITSDNSTIHSLVMADLIDQVLRAYSSAVMLNVDLTNMTNLVVLDNFEKSINDNLPIAKSNPNFEKYQKLISTNNTVVDSADYETALILTEEIKDLYNDKLKGSGTNNSNLISKLEKELDNLNLIVSNKGSGKDLMELVHLNIHSSLQQLFNLKSQMNMNMNNMMMDR